eukprot:CAMPEP_0117465846 /NCGR_PEP_ID=MMETSP0784-20121206/4836_1 /TAXON_ID=39447 /ORGANISM="" /LENGTH=299 /DNA_ID=CAMNT_0005259767 /DNA_START=88 /DNA_END=987 /DNA_ORIENTATION=+
MDAPALIASIHRDLLVRLSHELDTPLQGLAQGARLLRGRLSSASCRRLRDLGAAYGIVRHVTVQRNKAFLNRVLNELDGPVVQASSNIDSEIDPVSSDGELTLTAPSGTASTCATGNHIPEHYDIGSIDGDSVISSPAADMTISTDSDERPAAAPGAAAAGPAASTTGAPSIDFEYFDDIALLAAQAHCEHVHSLVDTALVVREQSLDDQFVADFAIRLTHGNGFALRWLFAHCPGTTILRDWLHLADYHIARSLGIDSDMVQLIPEYDDGTIVDDQSCVAALHGLVLHGVLLCDSDDE